MTSQQYQTSLFEESDVWTLSVEDFRARLSRLQETDEVLKILEELCSLRLLGSHLFSDLNIYSLRMSKDSSIMKTELRLRPLSQPWMNWGTMWNGKCLTARISESPQNRERVFIIGHSRRYRSRFLFPLSGENQPTSSQSVIKIGNVNPSGNGMNGEVYQADGLAPTLTTNKGEGQKIAIKSNTIKQFGVLQPNFNQCGVVYETDGIAPTIRAYQGGGLEPKIIQRGHGYNQGGEHDIAPTLTSNSYHENNHLSDGFRIRKLTPRECWRLQGFPDWAFDKAQEVNSNSQLYKQAGNSVTVNVIEAIAKELG